jgi:hypothetical protein
MIKSLGEQHATPDINDVSFDERLIPNSSKIQFIGLTA